MARLLEEESNSLVPIILCPIIYFLLTPFVISVTLVNEFIRSIVKLILWRKYGTRITLVEDGCDSIWNYKTWGNTRNCLLLGTTERGAIDVDDFANYFEKNVLLHKETRKSRLGNVQYRPYEKLEKIMVTAFGYTCWKYDEKFNIKNHVKRVNERAHYTEQDLMELLSNLAEDMDTSKPQWEFVFVENYQDGNGRERSVLIIRFHHAYMDGLSLLTMFKRYLTPNVTLPLDPLNIKVETWKKFIYYVNTVIYAPYKFVTMMRYRNTKYWQTTGDFPLSGQKNYAAIQPIDMNLIKKIRVDTGASVPNIVCTSFVAAAKRVIPAQRITTDFLRFGEMVARVPYPNGDPQNRFAPFSYDVSAQDIGESAEEFADAVTIIRRQRVAAMLGPEPLLFTFVAQIVGRLPTFLLPIILDGAHNSVFYSNVPAFSEKMIFQGAELDDFCAWPPMPNQTGIVMASVSCGGLLKITGVADSAWLSGEELQRIFIEIPKIIQSIADNGFIPVHYFPQRFVTPTKEDGSAARPEAPLYSLDESSSEEGSYSIQNEKVFQDTETETILENKDENVEGLRFRKIDNVDAKQPQVEKGGTEDVLQQTSVTNGVESD